MAFRRKRVEKWSKRRWLEQVHTCFVSTLADGGRKATIVVHLDPQLLPRDTEAQMRKECADAGEPWEGFREFAVFCLECSDLDYAGYRMGDTVHELMMDLYREVALEDARKTSSDWIGNEMLETDLRHIPGIYKAAFLADITGREPQAGGVESIWILPSSEGPEQVVRFPIPD